MKKPTLDQIIKAFRANEDGMEVSSKDLQLALSTGLLHDLWTAARLGTLSKVVRADFQKLLLLPAVSFLVDYDQPLEDLVKQGNYDYANPNLTSVNFPPPHNGKVMRQGGQLVHFGRGVSTAQAERELDQRGLRPADIYELATFGIKSPKTQLEHPIVALGQRWRCADGECVGYLDWPWPGRRRRFCLYILERYWSGDCRFLAFPK